VIRAAWRALVAAYDTARLRQLQQEITREVQRTCPHARVTIHTSPDYTDTLHECRDCGASWVVESPES
jgi:hypothetical protein